MKRLEQQHGFWVLQTVKMDCRRKYDIRTGRSTKCVHQYCSSRLSLQHQVTNSATRSANYSSLGWTGSIEHVYKRKRMDLIRIWTLWPPSINSSLWDKCSFKIQKKHVRGHQDELHREVSLLEILNCACDGKAKAIARTAISKRSRYIFSMLIRNMLAQFVT